MAMKLFREGQLIGVRAEILGQLIECRIDPRNPRKTWDDAMQVFMGMAAEQFVTSAHQFIDAVAGTKIGEVLRNGKAKASQGSPEDR